MKNRYLLLCLFVFVVSLAYSQNNIEVLARNELQKRGLDEGRVREELLKRGVDLNNIDPNNKQQLLANEKIIREVIDMLEKEKNQHLLNPYQKKEEVLMMLLWAHKVKKYKKLSRKVLRLKKRFLKKFRKFQESLCQKPERMANIYSEINP